MILELLNLQEVLVLSMLVLRQHQINVCNASIRNTVPIFLSYSSQATTSCALYTWNSSGVATDAQFSCSNLLNQSKYIPFYSFSNNQLIVYMVIYNLNNAIVICLTSSIGVVMFGVLSFDLFTRQCLNICPMAFDIIYVILLVRYKYKLLLTLAIHCYLVVAVFPLVASARCMVAVVQAVYQ